MFHKLYTILQAYKTDKINLKRELNCVPKHTSVTKGSWRETSEKTGGDAVAASNVVVWSLL